MRIICSFLLTFALLTSLHAQKGTPVAKDKDVKVGINRVPEGYDYPNTPFPADIKVFKMDKSKHVLEAKGLTLIQVWTLRDGNRPDLWNRFHDLSKKYQGQGLRTLSVNFENGTDFPTQHAKLQHFFRTTRQPDNFYFDALGYITDLLKVPGFPIYYLVDAKGKIVFRTLGEDEDGVALLENEIKSRLAKKK